MLTSQTPVIWTVVIATIIMLVVGFFGYMQIPTAEEVAGKVDVPTNAEVQVIVNDAVDSAFAKIEIPEVDTEKIDKICELTNGCEFYEPEDDEVYDILNELDNDNAVDDFIRKLSNLIDLDEDEFELDGILAEDIDCSNDIYPDVVKFKDSQIRTYSEKDKDDGNWEVKVFLRVVYHDVDEDDDDDEVIYVVVTSVLDEGEYESLSLEEVSRDFEFE